MATGMTVMTVAPVEGMNLECGSFAEYAPFGPKNVEAMGGAGDDIISFGDFAAIQDDFVTVDADEGLKGI
jgi:hypothetical protein